MLMLDETCSYCNEFEKGYFIWGERNYGSRIITQTNNFIVLPSLGPLMEGHVLIVPREHRLGMSGIPEAQYDELEEIFREVSIKITEEYGASLFFEHGDISREKKAGSCIQHAHFHVLPTDLEIANYLENRLERREIKKLVELRDQAEKQEPYLFLEEKGERYVFTVPDVLPSQYLRQVIAVQLETPERWDWRTSPNIEEMLRTRERLRR